MEQRKLAATLSFVIFIALVLLVSTPVHVAISTLAIVEPRVIIDISGLGITITTEDIIVCC